MSQNLLLVPLLIQVWLTLAVYLSLTRAKQRAVRNQEVDQSRRALHHDAWPDYVQKVNNNLRNQFESPLLFYILTLIIWELEKVDVLSLLAAFAYVASRLAHAWVHTHSNYVPLRKRIFVFGTVMLMALAVLASLAVLGSL